MKTLSIKKITKMLAYNPIFSQLTVNDFLGSSIFGMTLEGEGGFVIINDLLNFNFSVANGCLPSNANEN